MNDAHRNSHARARRALLDLAVAGALLGVVACGSGGSSSSSCRLYASAYTFTEANSPAAGSYTCSFDRPSLTMSCTGPTETTTTVWATIDDAVASGHPIGK